jgi:hypothetical protein
MSRRRQGRLEMRSGRYRRLPRNGGREVHRAATPGLVGQGNPRRLDSEVVRAAPARGDTGRGYLRRLSLPGRSEVIHIRSVGRGLEIRRSQGSDRHRKCGLCMTSTPRLQSRRIRRILCAGTRPLVPGDPASVRDRYPRAGESVRSGDSNVLSSWEAGWHVDSNRASHRGSECNDFKKGEYRSCD